MTVADVFALLERDYPVSTACDFDNCGILLGDPSETVRGITVALDCDTAALQTAQKNGCNLIVTHHPVIFGGVKSVTADSLCYQLLAAGISVISMHTNLDAGAGGVNDCLCNAIGLTAVEPFAAADGFLLRRGFIAPCTAAEFAAHISAKLGGFVRFADGGKPISRVLVCSGSGSDYLAEVFNADCDALLTAEVKHHLFLQAAADGISLFDGGHFETENIAMEPLAQKIRAAFPEIPLVTHLSSVVKQFIFSTP